MSDSFSEAVDEIYRWVDEEIRKASPRCEISGRCCRFREFGHRLYLTRVEAERLLQAPLPSETRREEFTHQQVLNRCPYQIQGRCEARENRPLGCRIFFCDPKFDEKSCEITETALIRLKKLHDEHDRPWEYRDLACFLDEFSESIPATDSAIEIQPDRPGDRPEKST